MQPCEYFNNALQLFRGLKSCITDELLLAGRPIQLKTPSPALRKIFLPALQHLAVDAGDKSPALTIWYAENASLPQKLHAPPWHDFNAQGYSNTLEGGDIQVFFQPWQSQVFMYSSSKKTGIYWVNAAEEVPWWEATFSFRIIFHFFSASLPAQMVHAGAMAYKNSGVLITGPSGSGKSTSCLNLLKAGYSYLGDDYVWVELEPVPTVHTLYQTAKVEVANLNERFADWLPCISNAATYTSQKAVFYAPRLMPGSLLPMAQIKAILLPSVTGGKDTWLSLAPAAQSLLYMAPTTLHHLPQNRASSYKKLSVLSQALPVYKWHLGYDVVKFQSSFHNFITHA